MKQCYACNGRYDKIEYLGRRLILWVSSVERDLDGKDRLQMKMNVRKPCETKAASSIHPENHWVFAITKGAFNDDMKMDSETT